MQCPELCCSILEQAHTLIAGSTGSGKSVLLNSVICTALAYGNKQLMLIDPKRVELKVFTAAPVCRAYADNLNDAIKLLDDAISLMESRYKEMQKQGMRTSKRDDVYICIDELADLLISEKRKLILNQLQRLLQLGRASNIHLIMCTQVPNRKIIPAELLLNCTARVGLRTDSAIESRQIIGIKGCEDLPLYGYGYYKKPGYLKSWVIPLTADAKLYESIKDNSYINGKTTKYRKLYRQLLKNGVV